MLMKFYERVELYQTLFVLVYHLIRLVISEIMQEIVAEVKDECANRIKYDKSTVDARIKEMFHSYIRSAREPLDRFQVSE